MFDIKNMNEGVIGVALKNIKKLILIGAVAGVLSIVFSSPSFIAPKFQSQAVVYPSNLGEYSDESPIEQMMQWFESRGIKEKVIAENNLAEHYDVDVTTDSLGKYWLLLEYDENVSINETKYESAEITVKDTEPEKAYQIVNSILKHFNQFVRAEHRKRAKEDFITVEKQLNKVKVELDSVNKELTKIRMEHGIINYGAQSHEVTKGFLKTVEGANKSNINQKDVLALKRSLEEKGGEFVHLNRRVDQLIDQYKDWEEEYRTAYKTLTRDMTYTNVVSPPYVSYKKVYPVRWLIVLGVTFSTVLFAFVLMLFFNRAKK